MKNTHLIAIIGLFLTIRILQVNSYSYQFMSDVYKMEKMIAGNQVEHETNVNRKQREKQKFLKNRFEKQSKSLAYRLLTLIGWFLTAKSTTKKNKTDYLKFHVVVSLDRNLKKKSYISFYRFSNKWQSSKNNFIEIIKRV